MREYVRRRRRELGEPVDEVFVPLVHEPGVEAEVDWGEAEVEIAGQRRTVYLFLMRACFSGAAFVIAFERERQQAFLEAHVEAFRFFGGMFALIRYDNLRAAVKQVLRGRRRVEQDRFVALRSHYLYESVFTRRGREGAHEKGGVEGEVGRFRRRHLVPVPKVATLKELNDLLEDGCFAELERRIGGRAETVGEALRVERRALRELPIEDFDPTEQASPRVDAKALVTIRQNRYSVPVALVGLRVAARIGAREIVIRHQGREVARHPRLHGRYQTAARLDHYLELLQRKPGALKGSLPLRQERERGRWPGSLRRALAGARTALRRLRGGAADGRRAAALPRARPRPGRARRPRRARRRRPRRPRGRAARPPQRAARAAAAVRAARAAAGRASGRSRRSATTTPS